MLEKSYIKGGKKRKVYIGLFIFNKKEKVTLILFIKQRSNCIFISFKYEHTMSPGCLADMFGTKREFEMKEKNKKKCKCFIATHR